jgi:hypothetical protein
VTDRPAFDPWSEEDFAALPTRPADEVVPFLVQADADLRAEDAFREGARVVVNVAGWMKEPVKVPLGCLYLAWRIDDDPSQAPDAATLRGLASLLADRVREQKRVVVYCAGGLNRSGLVVAQTLIELGRTPAEAIALVRAARGKWALSNLAFETLLLDQER